MSFSKKYSFHSFVFIGMELFVLMLLCLCLFMKKTDRQTDIFQTSSKFIKWVDFNVTSEALDQAFRYDVDTCQAEIHLNWVDLLAYLGTRYGGDFSRYKKSDMKKVAEQLINGEMTMEELTSDMKYYDPTKGILPCTAQACYSAFGRFPYNSQCGHSASCCR